MRIPYSIKNRQILVEKLARLNRQRVMIFMDEARTVRQLLWRDLRLWANDVQYRWIAYKIERDTQHKRSQRHDSIG